MSKNDRIPAVENTKETIYAALHKPLLTVPQQIKHLKSKGVTFELCDEDKAARMLTEEMPYFSLACYRHLFERHVGGPHDGQYVNLDFGHLAALQSVDRALRATLLQASLDVEQAARARLNAHMMETSAIIGTPENGYSIVEDYLASQGPDHATRRIAEIKRLADDEYRGAIVAKYIGHMPAWVFLEVATFGTLVSFYRFCADRWNNRELKGESFALRDVKNVRNACAHGSAIINGLANRTTGDPQMPQEVVRGLGRAGISRKARKSLLASRRAGQMACALYMWSKITPHKPVCSAAALLRAIDQTVPSLPGDGRISARLLSIKTLTKAFGLV